MALGDVASWPRIFVVKLSLVLFLLFVTLLHDWVVGSRLVRIMTIPVESGFKFDEALLQSSSWLP